MIPSGLMSAENFQYHPRTAVITGYARSGSSGATVAFDRDELEGRSQIGLYTDAGRSGRTEIAAPVGFNPEDYPILSDGRVVKMQLNPYTQMTLGVAYEAAHYAGLLNEDGKIHHDLDSETIGVALGTGAGAGIYLPEARKGILESRKGLITPSQAMGTHMDFASSRIEKITGAQGETIFASEACATGISVINDAVHSIWDGRNDAVIAVASEYLDQDWDLAFGEFKSVRALSSNMSDPEHASRPFDKDRGGFVLALQEAGAVVIETLEHAKKRGANILAVIPGVGKGSDANPDSNTEMDTERVSRLINNTMKRVDAKEPAKDGDGEIVIFAHATSTKAGDVAEAKAHMNSVLGRGILEGKTYLTAGKGRRGHSLGSAGMITFISALQAIRTGWVPPTLNLENLDPEIENLGYKMENFIRTPKQLKIIRAIPFAAGFGGRTALGVVDKFDPQRAS